MIRKSLSENWLLAEQPLYVTRDNALQMLSKTDGWMKVPSVPCDVHTVLVREGKIADPFVGDGSFECEWVEKRSWWFLKKFTVMQEELKCFGAELFIETLDIHADLFLNGDYIGHHSSAFYPFQKDILPHLKAGENTLLVRLTTGIDCVKDEDVNAVRDFVACEFRSRREGRGEDRRTILRKPQHVFGWDQAPRLATCCIAGEVRLDFLEEVVVRDVRVETLALHDDKADLLVEAEIESRERNYAREITAEFTLEKDGKVVHTEKRDFLAQTGCNFVNFNFTLDHPELWWPNGYGEQNLYCATVRAVNMYGYQDEKSVNTGIRTVSVDMTAFKENHRRYAFFVNGKRIYAKGADYIQTHQIYAEVTKKEHDKLIKAAKDAHFNMIRFWDGNRYHEDYVYDLCDQYGILVYQNFCFACGAYPDHLEEFCRLVEIEAEYQLKRLRSHPCIALWCGNGECNGLLRNYLKMNYFSDKYGSDFPGGTKIYGEILPKLHHRMVASVGYQCCSPFGGFENQAAPERGEMHYYPFLHFEPENLVNRISYQSFDPLETRFITESGVMGPPSAKSLERSLGGKEHYDRDDKEFEHHRNTFERHAVRDAIYKHYTGERKLSIEEYCLYGGLFQGSMLSYASDHVRMCEDVGGTLFWCFNDGFGEVGFSFTDAEQNPKPVYYFMKRAYAANRVILKRNGEKVDVYCSNDQNTEKEITLSCGYVTFDGRYTDPAAISATLPENAPETYIGSFPLVGDDHDGVFYAKCGGETVAVLWADDFKHLRVTKKAKLQMSDIEAKDGTISFTVEADVFAHAVHFGLTADKMFSDQYFDLLPGERRQVTLQNAKGVKPEDIKPDCVVVR